MAYKHGTFSSEVPTSLVPMTESVAGLPVVFGTAPVQKAASPAKANTPILCYKYSEAVEALGYSDDWESYTLCEFIQSFFSLYNMAPVVLVNVLDIDKDKKSVTASTVTVTDKKITLDASVIRSSLVLKATEDGVALVPDTDYTLSYDDDGNLLVTIADTSTAASAETLIASFDAVDPSKVTADDVAGGVDADTGAKTGLELVSEVYPRFGLVPGILLAPGFSDDAGVMAALKSKTENINGHFKCIALADIPTDTVKKYTDVAAYKNKNNFVGANLTACWPMLSLAGKKYHFSTQLAGLMCKTDGAHDDVPYWSPSNQSLQCDGTVLKDGTEVYLDMETGAYLNSQGIVTAINQNGWIAFGNRTTAYPGNTDVKDAFIPIRRMFCWVANTLMTTFWQKIDNPTNKRLIASIVKSANIWLQGLTAQGALLGGRVEFREDENTTLDVMDGKLYFHVYMTPPSPAREITFVQEYDPDYISTLFE